MVFATFPHVQTENFDVKIAIGQSWDVAGRRIGEEEQMETRKKFGRILKRERNWREWTQEQLATVLGCDKTRVTRIETGRVSITVEELDVLRRLGFDVQKMLADAEKLGPSPGTPKLPPAVLV